MDLGVGQPAVVVDDRVHDVDAVVAAAVLARAVAGEAVAGPLEADVLARVHVQQVSRTRPLVAVGWLTGCSRWPREPGPREHLPHGRVAKAGRAGDQPRPPTCLAATGADRLGELGGELARRAVRTAGAIEQARQRPPRLLGLCPAMPPAVR